MSKDLFAAADDILGRNTGGGVDPTLIDEGPGEFTKGLRAGAYGAGSQLQSVAGLAGEALGFDEFGRNRAASASRLQERARENAPRVGSYKQVLDSPDLGTGLRNGADYVKGILGGSVPVAAAGVVGGLATGGSGAIPAMLGAAGAMAPFEIGDVIQKQNADPEAMQATPGRRLRDAALAGGASALAQGIVPGGVSGKLAGRSIKGVLGHNLASIPIEGIAEGTGEAIKQYGANQNKPLDVEAIKENAVGGAAAGGAFGAVGAAGDLAHGHMGGASDAIKSVASAAKDKLPGTSAWSDVSKFLQKGRTPLDDSADRVLRGEPLGDPAELAAAQGDRLTELVGASDNAALQKAQQWGSEMLNDAGLSPERRQAVSDAMQNVGDRAGQTALAGLKKTYDTGKAIAGKLEAFASTLKAPEAANDAKRSEDYSGVRKVIAEEIAPMLQQSQPELLADTQSINRLADGLRMVMEELPRGPLSSDTVARMIDLLGKDTVPVLTQLQSALGETDPAKTEQFFKNLNEIADTQKRSSTLQELIGSSLTPEAQKTALASDLGELTEGLVKWARGEMASGGKRSAQDAFADRQMREFMAEQFGPKADAVSKAIEKEAGLGGQAETAKEGDVNADGDVVAAEQLDTVRMGRGKNNDPVMDPALFKSRNEPGQNYAEQYMKDLQAKYPDRNVRFEKAEGSHTHGHVVAEKAADPEALTDADVQGMRLDTKKYPNSRDRMEVADMILDTRRIAKVMDRRLEYSAADEQSRGHRLTRMFIEGLARLQEKHGDIKVPDKAVLGKVGGQDFTFGMAKKLTSDTASATDGRTEAETTDARLARLERTVKNLELAILNDGMTTERREAWMEAKTKLDEAQAADRVERDLEKRGITERSKDEQIHQAAIGRGVNQEPNKSNMDGSPHSVSDRVTEDRKPLVLAVTRWARSEAAPAKAIGARAKVLLDNIDKMGKADRARFTALAGASPAEASSVVNDLARKYKDMIVVPDGATKNVAKKALPESDAKELGKRLDYLNEPPKDYETATAKKYVEDARTQLKTVQAEKAKLEEGSDAWNEADDKRILLAQIVKKGESVLEGDESLKDVEGTPDPKALAAKKAALLKAASSSDPALLKELSTATDAKALQRTAAALPPGKALDTANERLAALVQNPDVAYSLQATHAGTTQTAQTRADVEAHINKVLGKSVKVMWSKMTHAGDFERTSAADLIRLSVHALDPMSTSFHESFHAFAQQLKDAGANDVYSVLERAAQSPHVLRQLTEAFKGESSVLAQLKDPEERMAYMYQLWAGGQLEVGPQVKGVFRKIADFIRGALGIWSNDERALHILDYFHTGEYAKHMGQPGAVREALMAPGRNQALDAARAMAKPLTNLADAVVSTGSARLRDTNVPALNDLADAIKREQTDANGGDQGFISAARVEATKLRSALGVAVKDNTSEQLQEAMEALQRGTMAPSPEARLAQRAIKRILANTRDYMVKAGVQIGDLGPDYFPRVWDTHYISKHPQAFREMLEPYVRSGDFKGDPTELMRRLMTRDGAEFGIETRTPGMQFKKERLLSFIKPEDAAEFVTKDLFATLNSYITQATRRAEWNRRLGDGKLEALIKKAEEQGATPEQLKLADQYLRGVDGTLGDDLNPHARRIMGNMIVYQNVRLLPLAMFSSIVDPMGVLVRGGTVADAWKTFTRGMSEIPESFGRKAKGDESTRLAELVGVVDSAVLASTMGDMYTQGMVGGTAQKINNAFFRFNMMEGLNRSFRIGASEAAMRFIGKHADGSASPHSKRWMAELGLDPADVKMVGDRIALTEAEGLTPEQVTKVHAAINQWVDGAVLRPDAADKPIWMNDPHYALISHLKQFVYSFQKTIIGRVAHEFEHGNFTPAMALASYVPIMIAADFAKGLLQGGGDQPEWKKGWGVDDYIGHGIQRAGLLGVGQFGYDVAQDVQRGGLGLGALAGPTIEQFADAVQLLGGHKQFGPFVLNAMPANALYAHVMDGASQPDPMFAE